VKKNIIVKLDRCTLKNMPTKKKSLNGVGLKKNLLDLCKRDRNEENEFIRSSTLY